MYNLCYWYLLNSQSVTRVKETHARGNRLFTGCVFLLRFFFLRVLFHRQIIYGC